MENKKLTIKEHITLIFRGYKKINELFRNPVLLAKTLTSLFNAITPFINIYFSALIINELSGDRDKDLLVKLVLLTISINLIFLLLKSLITRWKNYSIAYESYIFRHIYSEKLLSMDYVDVENPEIQDRLLEIKLHQNGMGFGIRETFDLFDKLVENFIKVILAISIVVTFFKTSVPYGSPYDYLDSSLANLLFILVLCVSIFLVPYIELIGGRVWAVNSVNNNKANLLFQFYMTKVLYENERGKDIRIYEQEASLGSAMAYREYVKRCAKIHGRWDTFGSILNNLVGGYIYLFIALKAYAGAFDVGSIVLYVGAITQLTGGSKNLVGAVGSLINNDVFLEKVLDFLDIPNKKYQGTLSVEKREDNEYQIEFKNVSFKYPNTEEYVLKNLNLKLTIGQRVAIVGMNGSGKTTMIKLLCRLYDVEEGVITLNGIDIKKYDYDEYMDIFSVVFQDCSLLPFSLGQNIATDIDFDEKLAIEYLNKSGFGERMKRLPKGLNTYIGKDFEEEGVEFSGGEKQKIALARALYKTTPFIILDEPTASLDPVAEFELYAKFDEVIEDKTAIYISHRLSSCRFCDNIIVFDKGELVQRGSHEELVTNVDGKYFELWNAQAQYYV